MNFSAKNLIRKEHLPSEEEVYVLVCSSINAEVGFGTEEGVVVDGDLGAGGGLHQTSVHGTGLLDGVLAIR